MMRWLLLGVVLLVAVGPVAAQTSPSCGQMPNLVCATAADTVSGTTTWGTGAQIVAGNLGVEFGESDTNPTCAGGNFTIFADLSENKLKKCQNGTATDLDTGASSLTWNSLTNPDGNLALTMAGYTTTLTWGTTTGAGTTMLDLVDGTSNTGTGAVLRARTASGSAAKPFQATAQGTANGVEMTTAGLLQAIGTGGIAATNLVFGSDAQGDLALRGASAYARLPIGSSGTVLTSNGTTAAWSTVGTSGIADGAITGAKISDNFVQWQETVTCATATCTALVNAARNIGTNRDALLVTRNGIVQRQVAGGAEAANEFSYNNGTKVLTFSETPGTVVAWYETAL